MAKVKVKFHRQKTYDFATDPFQYDMDTIYYTQVSGGCNENRTTIIDGEEYGREVPLAHHKLPYTETVDKTVNPPGVDALIQRQFMYDGSDSDTLKFYVVDDPDDFDLCANAYLEPDIKNDWEQFSYSMLDCEYGQGYSISPTLHRGNGSSGKCGYGLWSSGILDNIIKNPCNSSDYNGYIYPEKLKNFNFQSLIGTDKGNTTGDILGFALVNDDNAMPRNFVASDMNIYYRNSRYDLDYVDAKTNAGGKKIWCAWVCEDKLDNSARIIYSEHISAPSSINNFSDTLPYYDIFPNVGESLDIYKAVSILNRKQRTTTTKTSETVYINSATDCYESSGYIVTLNFALCNSNDISGVYGKTSTTTGSIFCWLEYFSLNKADALDTTRNHYLQNTKSGYYDQSNQGIYGGRQGYLFIDGSTSTSTSTVLGGQNIVKYESTLNGSTSSLFEFIRTNSFYNDGKLILRFSNPNGSNNLSNLDTFLKNYKTNLPYNSSELVIDFKSNSFTCKMLDGTVISDTLPIAKAESNYDGTTYLKEVDLWKCFKDGTKFMYFAESYQNIYIKCTGLLVTDYLILKVDDDTVWELDKSEGTYKQITGVYPINYFYGSHMSYNDITNKLWYSNGKYIYELLTGGDCCKYGNFYEEITYDDLKELRDNDLLRKGKQYRIIDYECTTSTIGTISAGHNFDIIVTADDVNKLNENARAVLHEGDTYFANSKLEAWEIKYCLDNDKNRFAWASDVTSNSVLKIPAYINVRLNGTLYKLVFDTITNEEIRYKTENINIPSHVGDDNKYSNAGFSASCIIQYNDFKLVSLSKIIVTSEGQEFIIGITDEYSLDSTSSSEIEVGESKPGKGVIWYMKDEWNNECPYDFKNIMFMIGPSYMYTFSLSSEKLIIKFETLIDKNKDRQELVDYYPIYDHNIGKVEIRSSNEYISHVTLDGTYCRRVTSDREDVYAEIISYNPSNKHMKFLQYDWVNNQEYIFENRENTLSNGSKFNIKSMLSNTYNVDGNVLGKNTVSGLLYSYENLYVYGDTSQINIKNVVIDSSLSDINYVNNNIISQNRLCYGVTGEIYGTSLLETKDYSEILHLPFNVFLGKKINGNKLGHDCANNMFYEGCKDNILYSSCRNNTLYPYCEKNTLHDNCCLNTFCTQSNSNVFEDYCYNNQISNGAGANKLGYGCYYIFVGSHSVYCEFGARCHEIWTGPYKSMFKFISDSCRTAFIHWLYDTREEEEVSENSSMVHATIGKYIDDMKIPLLRVLSRSYGITSLTSQLFILEGDITIDKYGSFSDGLKEGIRTLTTKNGAFYETIGDPKSVTFNPAIFYNGLINYAYDKKVSVIATQFFK